MVSCVDKNYLQHLGVLIVSLFKNKTCSNSIIYHVIHDDLSETDKKTFIDIEKNIIQLLFFMM
jgi:lipopolysaccharide biosynthesis glycosyltransferase